MVIYSEPIHFVAQQYFVLLLLCSVSNTVLVAAILKGNILVRECNRNILDKVFCSLIFDKLYLTLLSNVHLFWITLSISEASVDWGKYRKKKLLKFLAILTKICFKARIFHQHWKTDLCPHVSISFLLWKMEYLGRER